MNKQVLIVYYSYSNGNTKGIAESIQQSLGGTLCEIQITQDDVDTWIDSLHDLVN